MSVEAVLGLIVTALVAVIIAFFSMLWGHIRECRAKDAAITALQVDMATVKREIGDHENGLRGSIHDLRNTMSPLYMWYQRQMKQ